MKKIKIIPLVGIEFDDIMIALYSSCEDVKTHWENLIVHGMILYIILTMNYDLILMMTEK